LDARNFLRMLIRGLLLFGAGILFGYLTAPKTGHGTRSWISQRFDHWRAQGRDIGSVVRRRFHYEEGKLAGAVYRFRRLTAVPDKGKYVDDDLITQRIRTKLGEDKSTGQTARINVDTANNIVTLRGVVQSRQEYQDLERVAGQVQGVDGVVNKVNVIGEEAVGED